MVVRSTQTRFAQANAATGEQGWDDSVLSAHAMAAELSIYPEELLLASTGVIGKRIKMVRIPAFHTKLRHYAFYLGISTK